MTTMQDMFDLNTAIDQLKNVLSHDYNFETNDGELKTNVHIFAQNGKYSEIVQDAFTKFNRSVKDSLMIMINNLVDRRDEMTLKILQQNQVDTKIDKNLKESLSEHYDGPEGTDMGIL